MALDTRREQVALMDDDIIERAEAALEPPAVGPIQWASIGILVPELVAALKAARAENERLRGCRTCGNRTDPSLAGQNSDGCDCQ